MPCHEFGVVRVCREGHKIGPLFADDPIIAEDILLTLAHCAPDGPLFLDTPATNPAAIGLAETQGMTPTFETARMYRGPEPEFPIEHVFGITSFELG